jgi:hypothetical protein
LFNINRFTTLIGDRVTNTIRYNHKGELPVGFRVSICWVNLIDGIEVLESFKFVSGNGSAGERFDRSVYHQHRNTMPNS